MSPSQIAKLNLRFTIPTDDVIQSARKLRKSNNQDHRDIGKVVLELTQRQLDIQSAISKNYGTADFNPWFNYWFGDALNTAQRLKDSRNIDVSHVANLVLQMEQSIITSRESVLSEMKRLQNDIPNNPSD